jgi:PhnB protein
MSSSVPTQKVSFIPEGYHTCTPYLHVSGADAAIAFYQKAFGAKEVLRMKDDKGRIAHAEIRIGDSFVMLADEHPETGVFSPKHFGGTTFGMLLYFEDVDSVHAQALAAGAIEERKPADQFYGDRTSGIVDPFGHKWHLATHIEDVSAEEMKKRMSGK